MKLFGITRIVQPVLTLLGILYISSCKGNKNEGSINTVKLKNNLLIVRDIDNTVLELTGGAKDSISTLLKIRDNFTSKTLWCIIEVNQKARHIPTPLPSGVSEDATSYQVNWSKHYVIWFSSSSKEKDIFNKHRREKNDQAQSFLKIEWDFVVRVNFEKDQLLQVSHLK